MMQVEEDVERELRNEFILQQLLMLAGVLDLSDEVGRYGLQQENNYRDTKLRKLMQCSSI